MFDNLKYLKYLIYHINFWYCCICAHYVCSCLKSTIFYSQNSSKWLWTNNNLPPEIANIRHLCGWVPAAVYGNYCGPMLKKVAITELVTAYIGRLWIEPWLCCTLRILFSTTWDLLDILWTWSSMQHPFSAFHTVKAGSHSR